MTDPPAPWLDNLVVDKPNVILTEGPDEKHVVSAIVKRDGKSENIQVVSARGKDNIRRILSFLRANRIKGGAAIDGLGIVRDAEGNPAGTLDSMQSGLRDAGYEVPEQSGTVVGTSPSVRYQILPSDTEAGMLEDIYIASIRDRDEERPIIECADQFTDCIDQARGDRDINRSKVTLYAYLAANERPGRLVSEGVDSLWDIDSSAFEPLRWIVNSFE